MPAQKDAREYANQIFVHVAGEDADSDDVAVYLAHMVAALFELSPMAKVHITDFVIADLVAGLASRSEENAVRAVLEIQNHWAKGDLDR
jgi:hypothetical protein